MERVLQGTWPWLRWRALGLSLALHLLVGAAAMSLAWNTVVAPQQQPIRVVLVSPQPLSAAPSASAPASVPRPAKPAAPQPTHTVTQARARPPRETPTVQPTPAREAAATPPSAPAPSTDSPTASPREAASPAAPAEASTKASAYTPASADAAYLHNPKPAYPALAQRRHQEGLVLVDVTVSAAGLPTAQHLHKSSGFSTLDQAALEAVRGFRFVPAHLGSEAVEGHVVVPVDFRLED